MYEYKGKNRRYWLFENGNKYLRCHYTKQQAIRAVATLTECENCTNCENCSQCVDCSYCFNCSNCINCSSCIYSEDCSNASFYRWSERSKKPILMCEDIF